MRFNSRKNKHNDLLVVKNNIDSDVVFKINNSYSRKSVATTVKQEDLIYLIKHLSDLLVDESKFINKEGLFVSNKRYKKFRKNVKQSYSVRRKFTGLTGEEEWIHLNIHSINHDTNTVDGVYSTSVEDLKPVSLGSAIDAYEFLTKNAKKGEFYELVKVTFVTHNNKTKKTIRTIRENAK